MSAEITTTIELLYIRTTGNYVVAEDIDGKERWFDVRKTSCSVQGDDVTVTLSTKEWKRRLSNQEVKVRENRRIVKNCITCKQPHAMEKQNFICDGCKSTAEWRCGNGPFEL